jgi:hypothetical protein
MSLSGELLNLRDDESTISVLYQSRATLPLVKRLVLVTGEWRPETFDHVASAGLAFGSDGHPVRQGDEPVI